MTAPIWPLKPLGELFDIGAGKSVTPAARLGESKYPFLRTANVLWGRIDLTELDSMSFSGPEIESKSLKKGDLLVCEGGDIGRAAIWNGQVDRCGFQNHLHRLRPKSADVVPLFFMYYLQAGFTQLGIYDGAGNETTIPNLSRNRLASLEVVQPPKPEQQKIAAVLATVQYAIEIEEKLLAATRELKQAAMRQLFTHGLKGEPQKETEIGPVPASWDRIVIRDLGRVVTGTTPKTAVRRFYEGGAFPFIAPGDLGKTTSVDRVEKAVTEDGLSVSRVLPRGSILFVSIGSSIGKVGITTHERSTTNQQLNAIIADDSFDPLYVCYLLTHLSPYVSSFASPSPVPIMSKGQFEQVPLYATHDKAEQLDIARILRVIDENLGVHERKQAGLQELFQTLLHELMTGRIRVADLEIDVSEVSAT